MRDDLGDRIKDFYESRTKHFLPRRTYTVIRIDGKAFHTYTKGLKKPFDKGLMDDMDSTASFLCQNIQGAKLAYVQSDEISIVLTDFDSLQTDAWFDGNIQKIASISASIATAIFNDLRLQRYFSGPEYNIVTEEDQKFNIGEHFKIGVDLSQTSDDIASFINYLPIKRKLAMFDSRVFQIPSKTEVINYFIWRQQDATKNSISSVAQSLYSHNQLNGKDGNQKQEMIFQKGINWNDFSFREKRGGIIYKVQYEGPNNSIRSRWELIDTPIFTENKEFLDEKIPSM